jgi:hypothetical protein
VAAAGTLTAQPPRTSVPSTKRAAVTAVTSGLVYVGAGRADGLREGASVWVARLGERGRYRVVFLSSKSAASRGDSLALLPQVGDTVEFVAAIDSASASTVASASERRDGSTGRRSRALRGRVGVRYLQTKDASAGISLRQPGLEILLDGPVARGAPVGLSVDIRPRRTSTVRDGAVTVTQGITGVYQAAIRFQGQQGPIRATFGRQYAPTLAGVGLFDGLLLELQRSQWGVGAMAGLAPEPGTLAVSSAIRQFGGYFQGRSQPAARLRWTLTAGGMASYAGAGEVNREFGFVQGTFYTKGVSAILLQEVDLNRGWKVAAGEPRFSPTSTYLSTNLSPTQWFSLSGGVDNRRNVRLYRDLATPEAVFDDRYRRGAWAAAHLTIARRIRIGGDIRTRSVEGADSMSTSAYSGTINVDRLTALGVGLRVRGTRYQTPGRGTGTLVAGGVRFAPARIGGVELNAGSRREAGAAGADRWWIGADADVFIRRSWFALASYSREWGRDGLTPTTHFVYAGVSYRF